MAVKIHELPVCQHCDNFAGILDPEPVLDRRGRPRFNSAGHPASRGLCSLCGAEHDDVVTAPWQDWRIMAGIVTVSFFMGWCGFGVYLFGYWSWRDTGGFTGWPMGSYIWTAFAGGFGTLFALFLLGAVYMSIHYLWVRWVRVKRAAW